MLEQAKCALCDAKKHHHPVTIRSGSFLGIAFSNVQNEITDFVELDFEQASEVIEQLRVNLVAAIEFELKRIEETAN